MQRKCSAISSTPTANNRVAETPLLKVFNLDKLNYNNDPQTGGDGFLTLCKVLRLILKTDD
jgi:hypothetical protein